MIHPNTELAWYGKTIGHGVRATQPIPRGSIVWVQCALDIVLDSTRLESLGTAYQPLMDRYSYVDAWGRRILCWDHGRYMNHNCDSNSRGFGPCGQIAIRDVAVGEELTCDYGEHNRDGGFTCACGAVNCRSQIRATDLLDFRVEWDRQIAEVIDAARWVDQPLLAYLEPTSGAAILAALEGRGRIPSVLDTATSWLRDAARP
jgi:hypothetical protein